MVPKNSIYKSVRSNKDIDVTNRSFINTSIKTGIVLQLMTPNNKKKHEEINQIDGNIIILKSVSYTRQSLQINLYERKRIMFQHIHVTY